MARTVDGDEPMIRGYLSTVPCERSADYLFVAARETDLVPGRDGWMDLDVLLHEKVRAGSPVPAYRMLWFPGLEFTVADIEPKDPRHGDRARVLVPPGRPGSASWPWEWGAFPERNLFSDVNLPRLHAAIARGPVIVDQAHYRGGCSPDQYLFRGMDEWQAFMREDMRPGDIVTVWSLSGLLDEGVAVVHAAIEKPGARIADAVLEPARSFLSVQYREVVAGVVSARPRALWIDIDGWDELLGAVQTCEKPGDQVAVFRVGDIEGREVVSAKIPNEKGETPIGGAY